MNIRKFFLSYYKNATADFYVTRITSPKEARSIHSHNYFQIFYIVSGKVSHHLSSRTAELSPGDIMILPPNQPHYIETPAGEVDFFSLSFLPDYFQNIKEANKLVLDFLAHLQAETGEEIEPKVTLSYDDAIFTKILFEKILAEFSGNKTGKAELIKELVSALLAILARVYFEENTTTVVTKENRQIVMHSIEYIKNHYDEDITLSEIARQSAMSKTWFCTIFNSIVGMPFKEYLNRYRIQRAAELIKAGEKASVAGNSCGFGDFSTFYRNFKKYMGISPSEFANRKRPDIS